MNNFLTLHSICYPLSGRRHCNSLLFLALDRKLLIAVKLGGEAISWAVRKLETNRNGLPTSPSFINVQNRVLQAAAKHESEPSDEEESTAVQSPDLSEAKKTNVRIHYFTLTCNSQ
ncbi:hypothetical protein Tco_0077858 [Tanacetum coccineum]